MHWLVEAHHIRNRSTKIFHAAFELQAKYRWCLTGTPIHNSLDDFGALLSFIGVDSVMDKAKLDFWIASPIKKRQPESMQRLQDLVRATCLRRTKRSAAVSFELPKTVQKTELVKLVGEDQDLYDIFQQKTAEIAAGMDKDKSERAKPRMARDGNMLALMNFLRLICDHGKDLLPFKALKICEGAGKLSSLDWAALRTLRKTCHVCGAEVEEVGSSPSDDSSRFTCTTCLTVNEEDNTGRLSTFLPVPTTKWTGSVTAAETLQPYAKVRCLLKNLYKERAADGGDKPIKR